ncbi:MAG: 3,8-cyclase, partial [Solirubrobacteraceae bacterium]|nr:3,8-cyclase [Solirubrobacteraceae bacterium]
VGNPVPTTRDPLIDGHGRPIGDVRISVTDRCNFRCQYCMPAEGLPWLEREAVLSFEEIERLVGLLASMGVSDVRISVIDRCNFRCQYCMPAEGLPWLDRADLLSFEEIERIVGVLAAMGVGDVRLTGGEPLVRRDLARLVGMLKALDGIEEISLTTNGYLLERQAEALVRAGVDRFNVSIDSLQRDRFFEQTRRDSLPQVLRGLEVLAGFPEAHPIKVNAVAIRGFTEQEILPFARFARETPYEIRFIEFMPLDGDRSWKADDVLTGREIRDAIAAVHPLEAEPRERSATARTYRFADGRGRVGFINPVSEPFCADCNRIRLTADGKLRTCLFSLNETDLRGPMRAGASDEELEETVRRAVWRKELKHHVGEPGFIQPARSMSAIGG